MIFGQDLIFFRLEQPENDNDNVAENNEKDYDDDGDDKDEFDGVPLNGDTDGKMLFVYQSKKMKRLYRRYAKNLVLLDATYKTTKYTLPLYFLVVQTNVNFQVNRIILCKASTFL